MWRTVKSLPALLKSLLVGISSALLLACSPPHEPVNLAGNNWLGYQPFYVAKQLHPQKLAVSP